MSHTVLQRMEAQADALVGRDAERATLRRLLGEDGPLVVFVHGIAGVGKTTLAEAFAGDARAAGATVLRLDCRAIEPTERGFLAALASATGGELSTPAGAATRLGALGHRVVLILDTYEVLRLDPWLRQTFVPALTDNVRVLLSGREPPATGWSATLGGLFGNLPLGRLPREDAEDLLVRAGVASADAPRINQLARGHPLSLRLAAGALAGRPEISLEAATMGAIIEELTELYLAVLDPLTRQALDAAAVVRRPTLSLLAAMLPGAAPQDAFDRLRRLPFVELSDDGLVLHETVREAVNAHLRSADPERSRTYRAAAWRQLRDEVNRAADHEIWRYTADLLFILQNPVVREAFFPSAEHLYSVEPANPGDARAIAEIVRRHEPPASVAVLDQWWTRHPEAFRVLRDRLGTVVGFHMLGELDRVSRAIYDVDPVVRWWQDHLRRLPVPRGQRVLYNRIWISRDHGEAPSAVQAASWLDIKRMYLELRPNLRRIYTVVRDVATYGPIVAPLGIESLTGEPPEFDGVAYHPAMLDFGPLSVDGWLAKLVAAELQIADDSILDLVEHQLVLDGHRVDLTRLEFEAFSYLYQRSGRVVARSALLRDVWGYDYAGGSNVVDTVVLGLRRKLGIRSASIETVRGLGYRYVATS